MIDGVCNRCGKVYKPIRKRPRGDGDAAQAEYRRRRWLRVRRMQLRRQPLCQNCLDEKRVTSATEVHHRKPLRLGGTNEWANLVSLCRACHMRIERALKALEAERHG